MTDPQCPNFKNRSRRPSLRATAVDESSLATVAEEPSAGEPLHSASIAEESGNESQPETIDHEDALPEEVETWENAYSSDAGPGGGEDSGSDDDDNSFDDDAVYSAGFMSTLDDSDIGI